MRRISTAAVVVVLFCLTLFTVRFAGARQQQPPGADLPDFVISDMRVQEFAARAYIYSTHQTSIPQIGQTVHEAMEKLGGAIQAGELPVVGPPIFVYKGATGDPNQQFELQVGFPVMDGAKAPADLQMRELEKYRCATVIYSGPMQNVGQAYQKIYTEIPQAGLELAGDSREMHMYFESPESPNNVVLIMVGVK